MEASFDLLAIRNETFIREISFHDEVRSTNSTAIELAQSARDTPLLVLTERQTAGRGRGGNSWWSSTGSLTFSLLMDLPLPPDEQYSPYSLSAGLAVCLALEQFAAGSDLAVKWPNDVYLDGRKVCGILIERPIATEPRLVVGIGINVNNSHRNAPVELRERVTSILDAAGSTADRGEVLVRCLRKLQECTDMHFTRRSELLDQWRSYCLLTGREVAIEVGTETVAGRCQGIDIDGALMVADGDQVRRCTSGVVVKWS